MNPETQSKIGEFEPLLRVSGLSKQFVQQRPFRAKRL
jgi:hypothetical protein